MCQLRTGWPRNSMCLLLVTLVLYTCRIAASFETERIIRNNGIIVPHGRTVFLNPETHLTIGILQGERCLVTVVKNDPVSQLPGQLVPSEFACSFEPKDVKYTHFGTNFPRYDAVHLLIRFDSNSNTQIIPVTLSFHISFYVPLQVVSRNLPISVEHLSRASETISLSNTQFNYDRDNQFCKLSVLSGMRNLPRYGYIANDTSELSYIDCDQFLQKNINYKRTGSSKSPNKDFIPIVLELLENDGTFVTQEYFMKEVNLKDGILNTPPNPSQNALLVMETTKIGQSVNQFILTAISPKVLGAIDDQTPAENLIFNITRSLGPNEGTLISTDDQNQQLYSFYQKDIVEFKIAYKPPGDDSNIPRTFEVDFEVIDDGGLRSAPFSLMIIVNPKQTLAPIVTKNVGLHLFEGQSRNISSKQNLQISDEDDLQNVKIFVLEGPRHGKLFLPDGRKYFTPNDLHMGTVKYQHDGSETSSDNTVLRMTDLKHTVEFLFPIIIFPVDDEPATLTVNIGLEIKKNGMAAISQFMLSASDIDSDDSTIEFVLLPPYSSEGVILKRQFEVPVSPEKWQKLRGIYQRPVDRFTQKDISDNKIFYQHVGPHRSTVVVDRIKFSLLSGLDSKTVSETYEFLVEIHPVDDQPPKLSADTYLNFTIDEFQLTPFKRKNLYYTDSDTTDPHIKYHITRSPFDLDSYVHLDAGQIVMCDQNNLAITDFQQGEIFHQKICYKPPNSEQGLTERRIQFYFDVEDANGNVLPNQQFTIILKPVNNQPPIVTNMGATVLENHHVVLTTQVLDVQDPDTNPNMVSFVVIKTPEFGSLLKVQQVLEISDTFSYSDLFSGNIIYQSKSTETDSDLINLEVTDGAHSVPIGFRISIKHIEDKPTLELNGKNNHKLELEVDEGGFVVLSSKHIVLKNVARPDEVLFRVKSRAVEGSVILDNFPTNQFSFQNILDGKVQYKHQGSDVGYDGKTDGFTLVLNNRDKVGNKSEINVIIYILPVDNIAPEILPAAPFTVYEGLKEKILPRHLDVVDKDTKDENIQCIITKQPNNGYVENVSPAPGSEKSRAGIPVTAFYVEDIRLGHINFVQSIHVGVEPRADKFIFKCSDGINMSPTESTFQISIFPRNDESPKVFVREFIVMEGMELKIDSPILTAVDADLPEDTITFIIQTRPKHGQIVQQLRTGIIPISNFTKSDIAKSSTIMYQHDNTESFKDLVEFVVTDGLHNVTQSIPIVIIPVDDETPQLTVNTGLEVEKVGERILVSNKVLKAEDLDSHNPNITFIIRRYPSQGYFIKEKGNKLINMTYSANFTQFEIDSEQVYYIHTGTEGKRDTVKLDITDGLNPLIDRFFYITVKGADLNYPEVYNKGVRLPEGGTIKLTTDFLSGKDIEIPDALLIFRVTKLPKHGFLYNTDNPNQPITTFTQLDLAGSKICYAHDAKTEIKMDAFEFEVTDGHNTVKRTFRIAVTDVDNKKPTLVFGTLFVAEGGSKLITPFELKAIDEDTIDVNIEFVITQLPQYGNILFNYSQIVTMFTNQDIKNNLISYQHGGTETSKDAFSFTVTDGIHSDFYIFSNMEHTTKQPQTIPIEIIPVDNGIPYLKFNSGLNALGHLDQHTVGGTITEHMLMATDRDSTSETLNFMITVAPKNGYVRVDNIKKSSWTQDDINKRKVQYILNPNTDVTSDTFFFKIQDGGGNVLPNQPFHVQWCWVSFKQPEYTVGETEGLLEITVQRRGYLGENVYVDITADNGTSRAGEDFRPVYGTTIQFNPGQTEKKWKIHMIDNERYEGSEYFFLRLHNPQMAVLENTNVAKVTVNDFEDESVLSIPYPEYSVAENIGEIMIPIKRSGDLMDEFMVVCCTKSGTATGTLPDVVNSGADFISRSDDHHSTIRFDVGEDTKYCRVTIIDDSLNEEREFFHVILMEPMGGRVIGQNWTTVFIEPDSEDEPKIYFNQLEYYVDESAGTLEVVVWRGGIDLSKPSSVTLMSRQTEPVSAIAGDDYVAVNKILNFPPLLDKVSVTVTILDDLGQPKLERPEKFQLVLRKPMGAGLTNRNTTTVVIDDSLSDAPVMEFEESIYFGKEKVGQVIAVIVRHGDIDQDASVRCYTRQNTALVGQDYVERPDTNKSVIYFQRGQKKADCVVDIVDDSDFEPTEDFRLVLGTPDSVSTSGLAFVGDRDSTIIKIQNLEDEPSIEILSSEYTVNEPIIKDDISVLVVPVVRTGDLSGLSEVILQSKDGTAEAGKDFNGFSKALTFHPGMSVVNVEIQILYDTITENRERFTILIRDKKDIYHVARIKNSNAVVYIEENSKMADVVFPSKPVIVSLKDYDDVSSADGRIINGYPVVCVTSCNPRHPDYLRTGSLCRDQGINDTLTKYQWQVGAPTTKDGVASPLQDIASTTFFASTRGITLDSVYFNSGSRIRCIARAVNVRGEPGLPFPSDMVKVSGKDGICPAREINTIGAEPFTAKLKYLGTEYGQDSGKMLITVTVPHQDGMLPVVSTRQPSNFEYILSPDALRLGQHKCSNLLDYSESHPAFGFVSNKTRNPFMIGEVEPYQNSEELRTPKTLRFYSNLDYEACQWKFQGVFNMTTLVTTCDGQIAADGQPLDVKQSFLTMRVPLYVSYVFHNMAADRGWRHIDTQTELEITFVYNTAVMWQEGIRTADKDGMAGSLYPVSMKIINNRLVVSFKTVARFKGQFVLNYPGHKYESSVSCKELPTLTFNLRLLRSSPTYDNADQDWQFESDFSEKDYSGLYKISLVPCITPPNKKYILPLMCQPQKVITFDLPIKFQQVSEPVPSKFTLDTKFRLMKKRELWLSEVQNEIETDTSFSPGDTLYARIDSPDNLGNHVNLGIDKVFLCSGKDGYIPMYDPDNNLYGCERKNDRLELSLKILDPGAPDTVDTSLHGIQFQALLAKDDPSATKLLQQPGADGFSIDTKPLFQADSDRVWYLHSVYSLKADRNKRDLTEKGTNQPEIGLNMIRIRTTRQSQHTGDLNLSKSIDSQKQHITLMPVLIGISILLIIILTILIIVIRKRKKRSTPPSSPTNTITVVGRSGKALVVHLPDAKSMGQSSEV